IWTGKDLESAGYLPFIMVFPLRNKDGSAAIQTDRPALAMDKVRFVGDPVAVVVASTLAEAREAGEAVVLNIDPLPSVTTAEDAMKPGAPLVYDHIPNNLSLDFYSGDPA